MRRARRVDANQAAIVAALRKAGASVQVLSGVWSGCPDLLVGMECRNKDRTVERNWLMEVKDGSKPPSERRLTKAEHKWHCEWLGQVAVVYDPDDALLCLQQLRNRA